MADEVLDATCVKLLEEELLEPDLAISWHGAEPLIVGVEWYRRAFGRIGRALDSQTKTRHVFQTNGTLINDAWCGFLKDTGSQIGISIDGNARQNSSRVNWAGRPAFKAAMRGAEMLNKYCIPWTLLSVVTQDVMSDPQAYIDFVRSTGCSTLGFKIEETNVDHDSRLEGIQNLESLYTAFVQALWAAFPANGQIKVREFEAFRSNSGFGLQRQALPVTLIPFRNLTVAANGDFTVFAGELLFQKGDRFVFGNVLDGPLLDCLTRKKFHEIGSEIMAGVKKCAESCAHYPECGSFYVSQKMAEHSTFDATETIACRLEVKVLHDALSVYSS